MQPNNLIVWILITQSIWGSQIFSRTEIDPYKFFKDAGQNPWNSSVVLDVAHCNKHLCIFIQNHSSMAMTHEPIKIGGTYIRYIRPLYIYQAFVGISPQFIWGWAKTLVPSEPQNSW